MGTEVDIPESGTLFLSSAKLVSEFGLARHDRGIINAAFLKMLLRRGLVTIEIDKWVTVKATKLGKRYLQAHAFQIEQRKRYGYLRDKNDDEG